MQANIMNKLYIRTGAAIIRHVPGSVGIDIALRDDLMLNDRVTLINLQVWLRWERRDFQNFVQLVPRSSTYGKYGIVLTNGIGIIDSNYSGHEDVLKASVLRLEESYTQIITAGEFFLQLVPVTIEPYEVIEDHDIPVGPSRGGFGSTDEKKYYVD
jgi:dUTP pyrophosphatase